MNIFEAIILGIIQGLSEFIPISSTAHLTIAGQIMGLIDPENYEAWTAFIAVIQLGTLAAVFLYFSKELKSIPNAFIRENFGKNRIRFSNQSSDSKMAFLIIVGSVPIITIGLLLKELIEGQLTKDLNIISWSLIGLAIILLFAELAFKEKKKYGELTFKDSVIIGLAQCMALIPGSSRSGTTLTAGLFLGINRADAAKFSFLLSIPAISGSGLYELYKSIQYLESAQIINLIAATLAAGISGYYSIAFLINYLKKNSTFIFIYYRIALGLIILSIINYM